MSSGNILHLIGGTPWHWCAGCGRRWQPKPMRFQVHDEIIQDSAGLCSCHASQFRPFPEQDATRAAYAVGGLEAVHLIEMQLYLETLDPATLARERLWLKLGLGL